MDLNSSSLEIPDPGPFSFLHLPGDPAFEAFLDHFEAEIRADERRRCEAEDITRWDPIRQMLAREQRYFRQLSPDELHDLRQRAYQVTEAHWAQWHPQITEISA
ncbi:hypothetical protein ACEZDB_26855 [Streptacidiphilus sp. N1-3]|uniref:Uncharacterized protein n=1 Tax=Streptacidiphilus alkalitolerans TaxID=3342712 RepID=A0ABV6X8R7_9ACTN